MQLITFYKSVKKEVKTTIKNARNIMTGIGVLSIVRITLFDIAKENNKMKNQSNKNSVQKSTMKIIIVPIGGLSSRTFQKTPRSGL